jgi:hypothetical protein
MNKNVSPPVRTGQGSFSARPAGVAQLGQSQGNHVTNKGTTSYTGERLHNPERNFHPVKLGNELAASTVCGVGGSRTLYGQSGSQGQYGSGGPQKPAGRPILSEYGPDYKGSRS